MFKGQLLPVGRNLLNASVNFWCTVYHWWPVGLILTEETEDIVRIVTAHKLSHEVVLAGDRQTIRTVSLTDALIQVVVQLLSHYLVGIHHQHPFVLSLVDGIFASRLHDVVGLAFKGDHLTAITLGNGQRLVCRLNVAYHNLVKVLHCIQYSFQMQFRIVGIDHYRYLPVHVCKIKHYPLKYQKYTGLFTTSLMKTWIVQEKYVSLHKILTKQW